MFIKIILMILISVTVGLTIKNMRRNKGKKWSNIALLILSAFLASFCIFLL